MPSKEWRLAVIWVAIEPCLGSFFSSRILWLFTIHQCSCTAKSSQNFTVTNFTRILKLIRILGLIPCVRKDCTSEWPIGIWTRPDVISSEGLSRGNISFGEWKIRCKQCWQTRNQNHRVVIWPSTKIVCHLETGSGALGQNSCLGYVHICYNLVVKIHILISWNVPAEINLHHLLHQFPPPIWFFLVVGDCSVQSPIQSLHRKHWEHRLTTYVKSVESLGKFWKPCNH